jgi:hypothetical protein
MPISEIDVGVNQLPNEYANLIYVASGPFRDAVKRKFKYFIDLVSKKKGSLRGKIYNAKTNLF